MSNDRVDNDKSEGVALEDAYSRWLRASKDASDLAAELFQPGSGYGDPDARFADIHRLESARLDAEKMFREYNELYRQHLETEMLKLQRSQRLATWASFAVAAVVGIATLVQVVVSLCQ